MDFNEHCIENKQFLKDVSLNFENVKLDSMYQINHMQQKIRIFVNL